MDPAYITLIILAVSAILFFAEIFPLPITAMLVPITLSLTGVIESKHAFENFGNKWVILFMGMFVVGEGIFRTGFASKFGKMIVKSAGKSQVKLIALVMLTVGVMSAFLSNTGATAVFIPIVLGVCASAEVRASRILMPMAFASSLGGTMTLIGTPPNLIINNTIEKTLGTAYVFEFFEFAKIGIIFFAVGILYYILIGYKFLPDNELPSRRNHKDKKEPVFRTKKMPLAVFILVFVIVMMITKTIKLDTAAMLGAILVIVTGCVTLKEAFRSISWPTIFLFAGMLSLSGAMDSTGAAKMVADVIVSGIHSPRLLLAAIFVVTAIVTNFMSNTATAAMIAPIGIAAAQSSGISPLPILMGVAMAASCCFLTPIATPPNTLVLGSGGYHFKDYFRAGWPLQLITFIVGVICIPIFWPF